MIYESVDEKTPFQQGDIFRNVPRVDFSVDALLILLRDSESGGSGYCEMTWEETLKDRDALETVVESSLQERRARAVVSVSTATAIVISQDCDAARSDELSMCEIVPFQTVYKDMGKEGGEKWIKKLTQLDSSQHYLKGFYLPADPGIGFTSRMAVDFQSVFQVPCGKVDTLKRLRVGRLEKRAALPHFREKLAHFFRRYAYDPWYCLSKDEFDQYNRSHDNTIPPFDWQK